MKLNDLTSVIPVLACFLLIKNKTAHITSMLKLRSSFCNSLWGSRGCECGTGGCEWGGPHGAHVNTALWLWRTGHRDGRRWNREGEGEGCYLQDSLWGALLGDRGGWLWALPVAETDPRPASGRHAKHTSGKDVKQISFLPDPLTQSLSVKPAVAVGRTCKGWSPPAAGFLVPLGSWLPLLTGCLWHFIPPCGIWLGVFLFCLFTGSLRGAEAGEKFVKWEDLVLILLMCKQNHQGSLYGKEAKELIKKNF